jgi:hypothetical protein
MPPEVADALKRADHFKGTAQTVQNETVPNETAEKE